MRLFERANTDLTAPLENTPEEENTTGANFAEGNVDNAIVQSSRTKRMALKEIPYTMKMSWEATMIHWKSIIKLPEID